MRILHVTHQFLPETYGGVEVYVRDLAKRQQAAGHDVEILAGTMRSLPEVAVQAGEFEGLSVSRIFRRDLYSDSWDKLYCPETSRAFRALLAEKKPEIVHIHHWIRLSADLAQAAKESGARVVLTLHDFALSCPRCFRMRPDETSCFRELGVASCLDCVPRRPWQDDAEISESIEAFRLDTLAELGAADAVVCAVTSVRDLFARFVGTPPDRFEIAPLGYADRFGAVAKAPEDQAAVRFGFWGAITPRKGVHLLIEAVRRLAAAENGVDPPFTLEIFGSFDLPERETEYRALAEGLPIRFHGRFQVGDIAGIGLAAAVFPSICLETYGLVLDEALELGVPVIVPDAGAMAERAAGRCLTFRMQDVADLTEKMAAVRRSAELRAALRRAEAFKPATDVEHHRRISEIYERVLARPSLPNESAVRPEERILRMARQSERRFRRLIERDGP